MLVTKYAYPLSLSCKRLVLRAAPQGKVNQKTSLFSLAGSSAGVSQDCSTDFSTEPNEWLTFLSLKQGEVEMMVRYVGCSAFAVWCSMYYFHRHLDSIIWLQLASVWRSHLLFHRVFIILTYYYACYHCIWPVLLVSTKKGACSYLVCIWKVKSITGFTWNSTRFFIKVITICCYLSWVTNTGLGTVCPTTRV